MSDSASKIRDKRVKPRFKIQVHARIKAQLIGSSSKYAFVTENISESGALLTAPNKYSTEVKSSKKENALFRHAFNNHSILEVWLTNDKNEEIFFFAKYVRKADDDSFAIRIIDIDSANAKKYQEFIESHSDAQIPTKDEDNDQ